MSIEYIVIYELIAVLIIVALISGIIWRDKSREIRDLTEFNQALLDQIETMQQVLESQKKEKEGISEDYEYVDEAIQTQLDIALDQTDTSWNEMERLVHEQKRMLSVIGSELTSDDPNLSVMKKEIKGLEKQLEKSERKVKVQKKELATSKNNVKELKQKMRKLSQRVLSMGGLEVSESRLRKDKQRLMKRVDELKEKYEDQRLISKNLEQELKTSFRANEVQAMRDELKEAEAQLTRMASEKKFIEQHFLELSEQGNPQDLKEELERAKREIQLLEQTVLEMDVTDQKNSHS